MVPCHTKFFAVCNILLRSLRVLFSYPTKKVPVRKQIFTPSHKHREGAVHRVQMTFLTFDFDTRCQSK